MWLCCFSSLENVSNLSIIFKSIISLILLIIPVLQMWWKHKQEIIKLPLESWNYWVKQDTKMFYLTPCPIDFYAFSVLWTKCRRVMFKKYWLDCYVCVCVFVGSAVAPVLLRSWRPWSWKTLKKWRWRSQGGVEPDRAEVSTDASTER